MNSEFPVLFKSHRTENQGLSSVSIVGGGGEMEQIYQNHDECFWRLNDRKE